VVKGKRRVLKVCPNCGSTSVRPVKEMDEWASIEEQMGSVGSDKFECDECGYKGELIKVAEEPEEDFFDENEDESKEEKIEIAPKAKAIKSKAEKSEKKKIPNIKKKKNRR
jgi:predicted RNA-binding Zn-ribbon protein involved in translation (DUF1610 family)